MQSDKLPHDVPKEDLKAFATQLGLPVTIGSDVALLAALQVGLVLRQVPRESRLRILPQLRNVAAQARDEGRPTIQSMLLDAVAASWDDFTNTGRGTAENLARAAMDVTPTKTK